MEEYVDYNDLPWRSDGSFDELDARNSYPEARRQRKLLDEWANKLRPGYEEAVDDYNEVSLDERASERDMSDVQVFLSYTADPLIALTEDMVFLDRIIARYQKGQDPRSSRQRRRDPR